MLQQLRSKIFLAAQEGKFSRSLLLRPLSGLWSVGANVKNYLYDRKWISTHRLPAVTVSVGNLVAGGSGKTPLVHLLAKTFLAVGPVAILSRGYRAKRSGLLYGDEPTMLSRRLPNVRIFIGKNRAASGAKAIQSGARLLFLDDGFQHRRLHRDIEIAILDASNPFGYGAFLPRGLLRDPPERLKKADAVFLNGKAPDGLVPLIQSYTAAPLIEVRLQVGRVLDLQRKDAGPLEGCPVGAFCAIAHPKRFLQSLQSQGASLLDHWFLPDHERADFDSLWMFARRCQMRGATALVCTEKDAVKLPPALSLPLPVLYLESELEIVSGFKEWQNLIDKIALKMNN